MSCLHALYECHECARECVGGAGHAVWSGMDIPGMHPSHMAIMAIASCTTRPLWLSPTPCLIGNLRAGQCLRTGRGELVLHRRDITQYQKIYAAAFDHRTPHEIDLQVSVKIKKMDEMIV